MTLQFDARRYDTGEPVRVTLVDGRIHALQPAWPSGSVGDWPWVAPAFFDLQINGHGGTWFSSNTLTPDDVASTLEPHFAHGITRLCPTLITASHDELASGFAAIDAACRDHDWVEAMVPGCHLEGPFISDVDGPRGAHPLEHVRPADLAEFHRLQKASGGRIRLVTLAPETEGACDFIRAVTSEGVRVAIGHTAADPHEVAAAVEAGATLSTHLGNGAHGTIRRHPNYIWEQLGDQRLWASIISDGHHLPESVIRSIVRTKTPARTIVTCDAAGLAGCPPGIYDEGSMQVEILLDGRIVLAGQDQLLAGSSLQTDTCVAHVMAAAGVSRREAFDMAGRNPAVLLGLETISLRAGDRADLVLFRHEGPGAPIEIEATLFRGELRHGELN